MLAASSRTGDGNLAAAVDDDVPEFFQQVHRVDRHNDGTGTQYGVEGDDELRTVPACMTATRPPLATPN